MQAGSPNWANKTIWTGDNLYIMRGMNSASVDLIYLDPPFNSKTDYAAPIGSQAAGAAFKDTWTLTDIDVEWINLIEQKHPQLYRVLLAAMTKSDKSYLVYMAARLLEMKRLLKPDGGIYLHCDPTMSHYLKAVMDAIFGPRNFRNEITWRRTGGGKGTRGPSKTFGVVSDCIFFYGRSSSHVITMPYVKERTNGMRPFKHRDEKGVYRAVADLYGDAALHDCPKYEWNGHNPPHGWRVSQVNLVRLHEENRIHYNGNGKPFRKQYEHEWPGVPVCNIWTDIPIASGKERVGYPTQKPLALLRRIIEASSEQDAMVLDPFCGCATTCVAADDLGRNWIGIDISQKAAELVIQRIEERQGLFREIVHREDIPERTDIGRIRRYNSPFNRKHLYGEQGGYCAGCHEHFQQTHLEVDHIISRKKGGTDHLDNLQLLCTPCNRKKGDRGMAYLNSRLQIAA